MSGRTEPEIRRITPSDYAGSESKSPLRNGYADELRAQFGIPRRTEPARPPVARRRTGRSRPRVRRGRASARRAGTRAGSRSSRSGTRAGPGEDPGESDPGDEHSPLVAGDAAGAVR